MALLLGHSGGVSVLLWELDGVSRSITNVYVL
jgi:hypothetical protein